MFINNQFKVCISILIVIIDTIRTKQPTDISNQTLKIKFASCEQRFNVVKQHVFGYPIKADILMCRCDCDRNSALQFFYQASKDFEKECESISKSSLVSCVAKEEEGMNVENCPDSGFAVCLVKLSSKEKYKSLELNNTLSYWRIVETSNEFIDIPPEIVQFIYNDAVYKISSIEGNCKLYKDTVRYFVKTDNDDIIMWKDSTKDLEKVSILSRKDWFIKSIQDSGSYLNELRSNIYLEDGVCDDRYSDITFSAPGCQPLASESDFGTPLNSHSISIVQNTIKIITNVNLSINTVEREKVFYFNGEIQRGDDGNQYLTVFDFTNNVTMLSGLIGFTRYDTVPVVILNNKYVKLKKNYSSKTWVCLHPDESIELKTCRIVYVNNDKILHLTTTTPVSIIFYNAMTENVTDVVDENSIENAELGSGVWILIALAIVCMIVSAVVLIIFKKRQRRHRRNPRESPEEDALRVEEVHQTTSFN